MADLQTVFANLTGACFKSEINLSDLIKQLGCNSVASRSIIDAYRSSMSVECFIDVVLTYIFDAVL